MKYRYGLCLPLFLALLAGCDAQPPVNRVQPNVTRKDDLRDGEWYFLSTVVDTPYSTDFTFVGEQGTLERIRWEIQEEYLVARRAYESIAGADPEGVNGSTDTAGAPVAMYRIEKHFDIRHDYNPVTGERLNVIVENDTDRPWYEREYMRVDWSENLVDDPNFMMLARYFNGLEVESVAWFVQDENDPNAPRFVREDPTDDESLLVYMDITNKMFVRPTTTRIPGLGDIPVCFILQVLDGNPVDCAPGEITVRNSFLRIDPDHDYQPMVYTGDRMERFGYFVTERPGYDRSYGLVEPLRYRFVNRHNIWADSHKRVDGNYVLCTRDADCDDGQGSVCDLDWGRARRLLTDDGRIQGACTKPFRDRTVQPIVYHLTPNWPEELLPEAMTVQEQYSAAFREVVASLRENECREFGGSNCEAQRTREDQQHMFYVCPTPVPEGAPEACGPPGTTVRIGDLRYNVLAWVNEPHRASPLGYGPSATDPLTGEIIAGNAYIYGAGLETVAAFGRDIVRLLHGDLTEEEIADGAPVDAWVARLSAETEGRSTRSAHDHVVPVDGHDVARIDAAMDFRWARSVDPHAFRGAPRDLADAVNRVTDAFERLDAADAFGDGLDRGGAALARLRGTRIERMMTSPEMLMMAGIDPTLPVSDDVLEAASPLRALSIENLVQRSRVRDRLQQHQGVDFGEFADEGLLGLARAITRAAAAGEPMEWNGVTYPLVGEDGGLDYDLVLEMLRHPILTGLALHEVGHTVGLRHNFSGSYDALNYHPRYWELRDDGNMRPRAWDPITEREIDGRISEYAYSTVMDYGHNFVVTDAHGLGHYDRAALKMGYADLVEVFEEVPDTTEVAWAAFMQWLGWPVSLTLDTGLGGPMSAYTYTEWPRLVGGRENLERRADVPYRSLRNEWLLGSAGIDFPTMDPEGRIAVPYRFCSDEQADLSPGCYRYDSGADAYESVQSIIDSYWNYYIFNNFRRRRLGFNVESVASRTLGRYFEKLQRANQVYALYRSVFREAFGDAPGIDEFFTAERGFGSYTLAVGAAYQALTRVVTAPEPGRYARATRGDGTEAMLPAAMGEAVIDGFDGRFLETTWDFDAGYFWFDQLERVGYFYDKVLALQVLTDPTTYFLGRDTDADIRRYQLNFASTFGPSVTRFFGGLLGEDWSAIAPRIQSGTVVYPDPLQIENGNMEGTPVSPNASFSIQLYAAVFGMALIPQTYDQDFLNRSRIWVRGGSEEVTIDPSLPTVEYTHPRSGLTYVAVSYEDADGVEHGVGAQLIKRANTLAARAASGDEQAAFELDRFIDNIDLVRALTWELGFGAQP